MIINAYNAAEINTIEDNKRLIEEYPFLMPRNRFTDDIPDDYDYSYTELDEMPDGWRIAFGDDLLKELKDILVRSEFLDKYRIEQIKEKFGTLRWYDNGVPHAVYDEYIEMMRKYESMSERTCIVCGAKATRMSIGWISPFCDKCVEDKNIDTVPIEEFLEEWENGV